MDDSRPYGSRSILDLGGATGNVDGPGSSTDNAIARFDGTTGKLIQNSGVTISDNAVITLVGVVNAIRIVTAAGAVTVAVTDYCIVINKSIAATTTVNLPATPTTGQTFVIKDGKGDAASNNITIVPAAGNIDGSASYVMNLNRQSVNLLYSGSEWVII